MRKTVWKACGGLGIGLVALFFCFNMGVAGTAGENAGGNVSLVGKNCPEIKGKDFDGVEFQLPARTKGKIDMLNFWGIRCGSCLEEMPKLDDIQKRYRDRGLSVYGVNVDGAQSSVLAEMLKKIEVSVSYRLLPDTDFSIMDSFRVSSTPLTVIVDDTGKVVYQHDGYKEGDEKEIETLVEKLLGEVK